MSDREALARAWDEGYEAGTEDVRGDESGGNPYRDPVLEDDRCYCIGDTHEHGIVAS